MNIQELKQTAQDRLSAAPYSPGKLAALHAGVTVAISLVLNLVSLFLDKEMGNTSGLSGITTRAVLTFAQTLLMLAATVATPFWELGFYRSALHISRGEPATPNSLLTGFRRFGPVLRLLLLRSALVTAILFACLQGASMLFLLSLWGELTMQTAERLLASGTTLEESAIMEMMQTMYPMYILAAILIGVVLIPILYRFRLSDWAIMDDTDRALYAMRRSAYWMHRRRFWLFRLDLSFWWYYGLMALASLVSYGDLLLPALGAQLNADVAYILFYLLGAAVQLVVAWRFAPQIQTTYALAYCALRAEKELRIKN